MTFLSPFDRRLGETWTKSPRRPYTDCTSLTQTFNYLSDSISLIVGLIFLLIVGVLFACLLLHAARRERVHSAAKDGVPLAGFSLFGLVMRRLHRNGRQPSPLRIILTVWGAYAGLVVLFFVLVFVLARFTS